MKGLFVKDFCLIRQKHLLFVLSLLSIAGFFSIIPWLPGMLAMLLVAVMAGTITSDKADHGWSALFAFPITRKQYVAEKYLFVLLTSVPVLLIACIESVLLWRLDVSAIGLCLAVLFLFTAFAVPTLLGLGITTAQNVLSIYFMLFAIGGGITVSSDTSLFLMHVPAAVWITALLVSILFLAGSFVLSVSIMDRKDL